MRCIQLVSVAWTFISNYYEINGWISPTVSLLFCLMIEQKLMKNAEFWHIVYKICQFGRWELSTVFLWIYCGYCWLEELSSYRMILQNAGSSEIQKSWIWESCSWLWKAYFYFCLYSAKSFLKYMIYNIQFAFPLFLKHVFYILLGIQVHRNFSASA